MIFPIRKLSCSLQNRRAAQYFRIYSARNAIIGSTRLALRAGIQQARSAMPNKINATQVNVIGSELLTPYKRLFIMRAPPKAQPARNRSGKRTVRRSDDSGEIPLHSIYRVRAGHRRGSSSQVTGQRGDGYKGHRPFFIVPSPPGEGL